MMLDVVRALRALARNEEGASAVEYGLLLALIAAVIVAAVDTLGGTVASAFADMNSKWP